MDDRTAELLGDYLSNRKLLAKKEREVKLLRADVSESERILYSLKATSEAGEYKIVYDHYVRRLSISACAKKYHYSKSGICWILSNCRKKAQ